MKKIILGNSVLDASTGEANADAVHLTTAVLFSGRKLFWRHIGGSAILNITIVLHILDCCIEVIAEDAITLSELNRLYFDFASVAVIVQRIDQLIRIHKQKLHSTDTLALFSKKDTKANQHLSKRAAIVDYVLTRIELKGKSLLTAAGSTGDRLMVFAPMPGDCRRWNPLLLCPPCNLIRFEVAERTVHASLQVE